MSFLKDVKQTIFRLLASLSIHNWRAVQGVMPNAFLDLIPPPDYPVKDFNVKSALLAQLIRLKLT